MCVCVLCICVRTHARVREAGFPPLPVETHRYRSEESSLFRLSQEKLIMTSVTSPHVGINKQLRLRELNRPWSFPYVLKAGMKSRDLSDLGIRMSFLALK